MLPSDSSSRQNSNRPVEQDNAERDGNPEQFHNDFPLSRISLSAQRPSSDAPSDVDAQPSESNIENDEEAFHAIESDDILNEPVSFVLPRQSEPSSARIQMIERERQARLERERAKIKRHFVLNREREAEDQAFEEADFARIGSDDHVSDSTFSIEDMIIGSDHDESLLHINSMSNHSVEYQTSGRDGSHHDNLQSSIDDHIVSDGNDLNINTIGVSRTLSEDDQQKQQQLGYTMELFLKERNPSQHTNHEDSSSYNSAPPEVLTHGQENDIRHDLNDPVMMNIEPDLRSQPGLTANHIEHENLAAASNMSVISHDNMSLEANRPSSDISSPTRFRSDSNDMEINATGRDFLEDHQAITNYPRLERLTEAEIFDLHDIDYASVGNMPPRSVRDERHLPEVVAGMSNFSNATHTTLLESVSSAHSRTSSSIDEIEKVESDTQLEVSGNDNEENPTDSVPLGVASIPTTNDALSPMSTTSMLEHQSNTDRCDASIACSGDSSGRKLPSLLLNIENDIDCSFEYDSNSLEDTNVITTYSTSTVHVQNRTIRPGVGDVQLRTKRSNYAHRRAQTTPNFPSFVDDFDYCKYNDTSVQEGIFTAKIMQNSKNDTSIDNYGSVDKNVDHWNREIHIIDTEPLIKKGKVQRSYDDMVDSVFSSVRSMSTEDIQAEIDECEAYASSNVVRRGKNCICFRCSLVICRCLNTTFL